MKAYWVLAALAIAALGLVAAFGLVRWRLLELGARLIVVAVAIHFLMAIASSFVIRAGYSNRLLNEVGHLFGGLSMLSGFAAWQSTAGDKRLVIGGIAIFIPLMVAGNIAQGLGWGYSVYTNSIASMAICIGAGYTLVRRVWATDGAWSDSLWFWVCLGLMLDFGTEVLLTLIFSNLGDRPDLQLATYTIHLVSSIVAYLVVAWAFWTRTGRADGLAGAATAPL
ncbi:MAG: hypothetical protein AB7S39_10480 [Gemmatimonadales bacterium]